MQEHPITVSAPGTRRVRIARSRRAVVGGRAGAAPHGSADVRPLVTPGSRGSRSAAGEDGFTLVELLVVAFMLIALVGIAVPSFVSQRGNANDAAIQSDLRSAAIALESFRAQNGLYGTAALADGSWGYVQSVDVAMLVDSVGDDAFCLRAWYSASGRDADGVAVRPEASDEIADLQATWAITQSGIVELNDTNRATVCA